MTDVRVTQLDSGLTVATERVPGTRSVAAGVWVGVGARDEPVELSGASHFLEHLLFKGTADRSALDISRTIDRHGGDINAFTTKEYTAYYCRLPARHAGAAIDLLGDVVTSPALRDTDVETERQVILEEIAMDDDSPDDVAHRVFGEQLFPDHPLGLDTAGTPETVQAITPDDVRSFFEHRYTAGSMFASIAGPLDHDEMLSLVSSAFARVRPGDGRSARHAPDAIAGNAAVADDTEQVQLVIGGRAFDRTDPDREALDVVNHVLGGGLSSRLFEEIRERRGLVYSVYSSVGLYSDCGLWTVAAGAQPRHADEVLGLIRAELDRLVAHGITEDELEIAIGYLTGSFELGLEDTGSRMARNAGQLCTRGVIGDIADQVARWSAVDQNAVTRVIQRVFAGEPIVVTVGPEG
ncbi:MAG: putative M16-family peptidase [Ilumatobacteraceae bacterium]|nr:putative M16-family peptidase [Ilumatobacteraceae bacterium]